MNNSNPLFILMFFAKDLEDANSVKDVLVYFFGILLIAFGFVIKYLIKQNSDRFKDKDDIIISKNIEITEHKLSAENNNNYIKEQAVSVVKVLMDNTAVLKTIVKTSDKISEDVLEKIKPVVDDTNALVKRIKEKIK